MNVVKMYWQEIITKLKEEYNISDICMKTWILPLTVSKVVDNSVYIYVDLKGSLDIIKTKYLLPLQVCIAEVTGQEYEVILTVDLDEIPQEVPQVPTTSSASISSPQKMNSIIEGANLNPKYTFDTFVVGGNNNFAHAASLAVSESPGEVYNPLFLYGGVGLGKTHLMHSVARYILEHDSTKKVLYVTSESFTNELIDALKSGKRGNESSMQLFREKYRNIDVLLIDDVQFIIGKESTQEEFFHTFNHLHVSGKQIIISSDRPPKDIETLEARLRTRFEWGLIADISAPAYETRMAILRKKVELDNLYIYNIPDEVMDYIANNVKSNIRELEGSLNKVVAMSRLDKKEIDIELASKALKDLISPKEKRQITIELILEIVSEHFNVSVDDLCSTKRNAEISIPRQIVMYLCRTMTEAPLKTIGFLLGGKDHSTINHGYNKIKESLDSDDKLNNTINIIIKKINPS